jgi:hypothetical protein
VKKLIFGLVISGFEKLSTSAECNPNNPFFFSCVPQATLSPSSAENMEAAASPEEVTVTALTLIPRSSAHKRVSSTPGLTPRRKQTFNKPKMRDSWNQ